MNAAPRRLAALLPALLAALAAAAPAQAQAPQRLGFAIRAADSAGANFDLRARPGSTVRGTLLVSNPTARRVKVLLRAQDAGTAMMGGLEYVDPKPGGAGEWLRPATGSVDLRPGTVRRVAFEADVPAGARPGDHVAGIVAYNAGELARAEGQPAAAGRVNLRFVSRFAVTVRLRVPGPAEPRLDFDALKIVTTPSGAAITVGIENSGDLIVPSTKGRFTVTKDGLELFDDSVALAAFVPRTRIAYPLPWAGAPAEGTYRVRGFLHPAEGPAITIDEEVTFGAAESRELERETGMQAAGSAGAGWWVWLLVAVLAVTALALAVTRRRGPGPAAATAAPLPAVPPVAPVAAAAPGLSRNGFGGLVDLNRASAEELLHLPGIGRAMAARIVAHRLEHGDFESLSDLTSVEGIGPARVDGIRALAVVRGYRARMEEPRELVSAGGPTRSCG